MSTSGAIGAETIRAAALREKCPFYPAPTITAHIDLSSDMARATSFFWIIGFDSGLAQTEARYRISFDRSRQKRGPPNQSLSLS